MGSALLKRGRSLPPAVSEGGAETLGGAMKTGTGQSLVNNSKRKLFLFLEISW